MRYLFTFLALTVFGGMLMAQVPTVRFTTDGYQGSQLTTIYASNLSKGWTAMLSYPDTVLTFEEPEGIDAVASGMNCNLYPNPAKGSASLEIDVAKGGQVSVGLYDLSGRMVADYAEVLPAGSYRYELQLPEPKVYLARVSTPSGTTTAKVVNMSGSENASISLVGVSAQAAKLTLNQPYVDGDRMRYVGVAMMNGVEVRDTIEDVLRVGEKVVTFVYTPAPEPDHDTIQGTIPFAFSVDSNRHVFFSMGNLQFQPSTRTWRFAQNQYDYTLVIGNDSTTSDWQDYFAWGTSGYHYYADSNNVYYHPWQIRGTTVDAATNKYGYGPSTDMDYPDLVMKSQDYDWGVHCAISNGGNQQGLWRSLTNAECLYLLNQRPNASNLRFICTITVGSRQVKGFVLLPDNFATPSGVTIQCNASNYTTNVLTQTQWTAMENNGAVFMPSNGSSTGTSLYDVPWKGNFWTSTHYDDVDAYAFYWDQTGLIETRHIRRDSGRQVRLVHDISE